MDNEIVQELDLIADPLEEDELFALMGPECVRDSSCANSDGCLISWNCSKVTM
ncbi:hypothetical protein ACFY0P_03855 [Streptomyces sp. NPDC001714]|uniref:hypothetical protein n=1 Tax=Streptomyces sp. NPDC001714 TaxID=3364603 RepID=UPI0036B982BF